MTILTIFQEHGIEYVEHGPNVRREHLLHELLQRIKRQIEIDEITGCWKWRRAKNKGKWNYGAVSIRPFILDLLGEKRRVNKKHGTNKKHRMVSVHRVVWACLHGPVPANLNVLHKCDIPVCCNPDHLFLGTDSDNARDAVEKGRWRIRRGEACNKAKLLEHDVQTIRKLYATGYYTGRQLAKKYNMSLHAIQLVILRQTWKHVQ